jgi:hypothetical protein
MENYHNKTAFTNTNTGNIFLSAALSGKKRLAGVGERRRRRGKKKQQQLEFLFEVYFQNTLNSSLKFILFFSYQFSLFSSPTKKATCLFFLHMKQTFKVIFSFTTKIGDMSINSG